MKRSLVSALVLLGACDQARKAPTSWRIEPEATVAIGGVAGDSARDLSRVVGAARLSDGSIVVANGATGELRWFDGSGTPRGITPRSDSLAGMTALFRAGDTVLVWDSRSSRLTAWGDAVTYHGSRRVELTDTSRSVGVRGLLPGGALLVESPAPLIVPDSGRVVRNPSALFRVSLAAPAESLGSAMGDEFFVLREGGGASVLRLPFGVVTHVIAGPWGYAVSDGSIEGIAVHEPGGRLRARVPAPPRLPVTDADRERLKRLMLGAARSARETDGITKLWGLMPVPDSFPAVTGLVGDPAALGWIREAAHLGDSTASWRVLDPAGVLLGTVQLPVRATPLDVGADYVLLHSMDAEGIERVQLHRLVRGKVN